MESLSQMTSSANTLYWFLTGVIVSLLAYRFYKIYLHGQTRHTIMRVEGHLFPKLLKGLFGLAMVMLLIAAPFHILIASPFKIYVADYLNCFFLSAVFLLTILEFRHTFTISQKLLEKTYKKLVLSIIVIFLIPFSGCLAYYVPGMFCFPSESSCVSLHLPVKGKWIASHAGSATYLNYHNATNPQQYALDILKLNANNEVYKGNGDTIRDLYTMHEKVYAPAEGEVINAIDSLPNHELTFNPNDTANPAGNHVVIEAGQEQYIFLTHLNKNTLAVQKGDVVKPGDLIGKIGNSGNTSWPHLHMHIQDKPKLNDTTAMGQPFRFKRMERKRLWGWQTIQDGYLLRNDFLKPASN